jgi:hypothetical protein
LGRATENQQKKKTKINFMGHPEFYYVINKEENENAGQIYTISREIRKLNCIIFAQLIFP